MDKTRNTSFNKLAVANGRMDMNRWNNSIRTSGFFSRLDAHWRQRLRLQSNSCLSLPMAYEDELVATDWHTWLMVNRDVGRRIIILRTPSDIMFQDVVYDEECTSSELQVCIDSGSFNMTYWRYSVKAKSDKYSIGIVCCFLHSTAHKLPDG